MDRRVGDVMGLARVWVGLVRRSLTTRPAPAGFDLISEIEVEAVLNGTITERPHVLAPVAQRRSEVVESRVVEILSAIKQALHRSLDPLAV